MITDNITHARFNVRWRLKALKTTLEDLELELGRLEAALEAAKDCLELVHAEADE